jgi:hypothetical protein
MGTRTNQANGRRMKQGRFDEPGFHREFSIRQGSIPHNSTNFIIEIDGER